ncbi:MAG: hypothetical protein FJX52_12255 [Alphaproteobacteria bacterium]|nr:hypothetical protein [Alphaproteobacteria bacterium]
MMNKTNACFRAASALAAVFLATACSGPLASNDTTFTPTSHDALVIIGALPTQFGGRFAKGPPISASSTAITNGMLREAPPGDRHMQLFPPVSPALIAPRVNVQSKVIYGAYRFSPGTYLLQEIYCTPLNPAGALWGFDPTRTSSPRITVMPTQGKMGKFTVKAGGLKYIGTYGFNVTRYPAENRAFSMKTAEAEAFVKNMPNLTAKLIHAPAITD